MQGTLAEAMEKIVSAISSDVALRLAGMLPRNPVLGGFVASDKAVEHVGCHGTRCYCVDAHAECRAFQRGALGQPLDCGLAGGVHGGTGHADLAR